MYIKVYFSEKQVFKWEYIFALVSKKHLSPNNGKFMSMCGYNSYVIYMLRRDQVVNTSD